MVAHASPPRFMSSAPGPGFRVPAFCSALGRVLLSETGIDAATLQTRKLTPQTVTDSSALQMLLMKVTQDGYALADQEAELGFRSIAVPVRRFDGRIVAALNIGVRVERADAQQMRSAFLPALLKATAELKDRVV